MSTTTDRSEKEQLQHAVTAHASWKVKLNAAIADGARSLNPVVVGKDNLCDFGKWLYSADATLRNSPYCPEIVRLHAQVHGHTAAMVTLIK